MHYTHFLIPLNLGISSLMYLKCQSIEKIININSNKINTIDKKISYIKN